MKALAIAANDLRLLFRFRLNVFFLFVLPMLIILLLGAAFGGSDRARIGVAGGDRRPARARSSRARSTRSRRCGSSATRARAACRSAVARGRVEAGLVLPAGYDAAARPGGPCSCATTRAPTRSRSSSARRSSPRSPARAACSAPRGSSSRERGTPFAAGARPRAGRRRGRARGRRPPHRARRHARTPSPAAATRAARARQLLLFIFLTSLTGAARLIETRRLGVARRMLSTPTSVRTILAGQTARPARRRAPPGAADRRRLGALLRRPLGRPGGDGRGRDRVLAGRRGRRHADRLRVLERAAGRLGRDPDRPRPGRARRVDGAARGLPAHGAKRRARSPRTPGETTPSPRCSTTAAASATCSATSASCSPSQPSCSRSGPGACGARSQPDR